MEIDVVVRIKVTPGTTGVGDINPDSLPPGSPGRAEVVRAAKDAVANAVNTAEWLGYTHSLEGRVSMRCVAMSAAETVPA